MVTQTITLPSLSNAETNPSKFEAGCWSLGHRHSTTTEPSTNAKLESRWSLGRRYSTYSQNSTTTTPSNSKRWSQLHDKSKCLAKQTFQPVQPAMEATKELAKRWTRRASFRNLKRKKSVHPTEQQAQSAATEYQAQAAHNGYEQRIQKGAQTTIAASRESVKEKHSDTSSDTRDIPAMISIPVADAHADPPVTVPANSTSSSAPNAPLDPSPGSEVSPNSQAPPKPAGAEDGADVAEPEDSPIKKPAFDYFTFQRLTGEAPPKGNDSDGNSHAQGQGRGQDLYPVSREHPDTPLSSPPLSTLQSPRESVLVDDGRSSTASLNGSVTRSRHSSAHSPLTYQLSNGHLPRSKTSPNSRDRNSLPVVVSRYVSFRAVILSLVLARSWFCSVVLFVFVSLRRSFSSKAS